MKKVAALASLLLNLAAAAPQAQQPPASPSHGRLFPPIDLGLLESPDRAAWQKPEQIMDVLHVADGSKVADIGAGAGWFTIHLARRVGPNGVVYSQDVQREMLEAIKRRVQREGLQNVQTTRGEGSNPNLPVAGLDAIVVVDAYQEVEDRVTFLQNLARALKPNGLIGVVNWKPGRGGPGPPENARVDKVSVTADVRAAAAADRGRGDAAVPVHAGSGEVDLRGLGVQFAGMAASSSTTLVHALAARGASAETARGIRIASLLFVTVLTIAAAQVSVPLPFTAVPLTLQPMVVLLGGLALGSRLGSASQILYLAAGIAGLPVFAASAVLPPGPLRLLGPTGGYLMAYPLAAFVTGYLAERGFDRKIRHVGACDARGSARHLLRGSHLAGTLCPHR